MSLILNAESLCRAIKSKGLTKKEAAEVCGYNYSNFIGLTTGNRPICVKASAKIIDKLGLSRKEFIEIIGNILDEEYGKDAN